MTDRAVDVTHSPRHAPPALIIPMFHHVRTERCATTGHV